MAGGCGGVLFTPTKVSLFEKGRPSPTLIKVGVEGAKPHGGGSGVPPRNQKRGRVAHPCNPATSGAQATGKPSAYGGGQRGSRGAEPPWRGVVGGVPHKFKRGGEAPTLTNPLRVGPRTLANHQPTGGGHKRGARGWSLLGRGCGGVPHETKRWGKSASIATQPRAG